MLTDDPSQVFLISGQIRKDGVLSAEFTQRVVVANDDVSAYAALASDTDFVPVGHASLHSYQEAAAKILATLSGESTDWPLLRA